MFAIFLIGEGGMSDHVELYFRLRIRVGIKHFLIYYHTERDSQAHNPVVY